jgi:hypothetical protein
MLTTKESLDFVLELVHVEALGSPVEPAGREAGRTVLMGVKLDLSKSQEPWGIGLEKDGPSPPADLEKKGHWVTVGSETTLPEEGSCPLSCCHRRGRRPSAAGSHGATHLRACGLGFLLMVELPGNGSNGFKLGNARGEAETPVVRA